MTMLTQRKFVKGVIADCSPIQQPPGSLPRISNLVYSRRGSLVTVDGSKILCAGTPGLGLLIHDIFAFQQNNQPSTLLALIQLSPSRNLFLVNVSGPTWGVGQELGSITAFPQLAQMLQFNNQLIMIVGQGVTPQFYDPTLLPTIGPLVNNFAVSYPLWSPRTSFSAEEYIQVPFFTPDGVTFYACLNWIANSSWSNAAGANQYIIDSNNNAEAANATGISGYGPPTWPTTPLGTNTTDGASMAWKLVGLQGTAASHPSLVFFEYVAIQGGITSDGPQPPVFKTDGVFPRNPVNSPDINDGSVIWRFVRALVGSAQPPLGAAHGIIYGGALWVFNTYPTSVDDSGVPTVPPTLSPTNGPTCLRMSDTNNPNSWNPANIAFLGKDDGTQGRGLAVFTIAETGIIPTQSLIAFKDFTTYQITGVFGASDFSIQQAQTDMGCLAPRTIQFLPGYGIGRLAHLGFAVFDGVRDRLISDDLDPYLFGDPSSPDIIPVDWSNITNSHSAQSTDPAMYLAVLPIIGSNGVPVRIFCYDLILKAWTIVDLPWEVFGFRQIRVSGLEPYTVVGDVSGNIRRVFGGDPDWDGTPITWAVRTPEVYNKSYAENIYTRAVYVRGSSPGGIIYPVLGKWTTDQNISTYFPLKLQPLNNSQFEFFMQMHSKSKNIHADFTGQGRIVIDSFDWDAEQEPAAPSILV